MRMLTIFLCCVGMGYSEVRISQAGATGFNLSELQKAQMHGAQARVTFCVKNSQGQPVSNATISAAFSDDKTDRPPSIKGQTDKDGLLTLEHRSNGRGDVAYTVSNDGYYDTYGKYSFMQGKVCTKNEPCEPFDPIMGKKHQAIPIENGRWIPWNPMIDIVLKEKRNPQPMYVKVTYAPDIVFPLRDVQLGFDCVVGDLVMPHGKGRHADLFFEYSEARDKQDTQRIRKQSLKVSIADKQGGFIRKESETWSVYLFAYEAPLEGYVPEVTYYWLCGLGDPHQQLQMEELSEKQYLVFRTRTELDREGRLIKACYGVLEGRLVYGATSGYLPPNGFGVRFRFYFNPTPNDRSLEWNGKNLFAEGHPFAAP